ncbi:hypothetical protein [Streptomyces sp. YKOK-I1]
MSANEILAALAALGDPAALPVVVDTLGAAVCQQQDRITRSALEALRAFGPAAAGAQETIRSLTTATDARIHPAAVAALWAVGGDLAEVMPLLLNLLDDPITFWISDAADLLGETGPSASAALPRLQGLLTHDYAWVRVHCAAALWESGGQTEAPAVLDALLRAMAKNPATANHVVTCLVSMGPLAAPALPRRDGRFQSIDHHEELQRIGPYPRHPTRSSNTGSTRPANSLRLRHRPPARQERGPSAVSAFTKARPRAAATVTRRGGARAPRRAPAHCGERVDVDAFVAGLGSPIGRESARWNAWTRQRMSSAPRSSGSVSAGSFCCQGPRTSRRASGGGAARLGVLTSRVQPIAEVCLASAGLVPDAVAMIRYGAEVYVGDHVLDMEGAWAAGVVGLGVTTGSHDAQALRDAGVSRVVRGLSEVTVRPTAAIRTPSQTERPGPPARAPTAVDTHRPHAAALGHPPPASYDRPSWPARPHTPAGGTAGNSAVGRL